MSLNVARARRNEALLAYAFLFPSLVFLAVFTYWPILRSIWFSLHDVVLGDPEIFWLGAENYLRLLDDGLFWKVFANTALYTLITIPLAILVALLLAVALDSKLRGIGLYRSAFFYPVMIPSVAAGMVWVFLYAPGYGPINEALTFLGLPRLDWLYSSKWALPAIMLMSIWKYSGYFMLILLAALKLVPSDLYEAARLDGVSAPQRLIHITVPLISPTLYFVIVIGLLHSYQIFDYVYVMTQGGPADATNVLTFYIYQNGFQYQDIGYASTLANTLLVFVLGLIGLVSVTLGRRVHYLGER
ncbi:carbohydrate ABC transporter permease [Stappia indica]|uniref:carbohydrate ABC transporter permease n=1 Tax=Stappia indica TaxID=538381 RepID=UPI001CD2C361|nr:sugar ABC transporter permease [Stappia indica]MCA1300607.1 sugar ABC transporter permease [Stappia indica]